MRLPIVERTAQQVGGGAAGERLERGRDLGPEAAMAGGAGIDHLAAAARLARRRPAQDGAVATRGRDRALEPELRPAGLARPERVAVEQRGPAGHLGRADE